MTGSSNKLELAENKLDLDNYEVIFVGYPIWWGKAPKIVEAFFSSMIGRGKQSFPFARQAAADSGLVTKL